MIRDNLFSTCVYTLDNVLPEKDNNIIKKDLLKEWKKTVHPKWQSKSNLQLKNKYKSLCSQITKASSEIFKEQDLKYEKFEITSMWANLLKTKENFHSHVHANNYLSGVYYVETKNTEIHFFDPRPQASVIRPAVNNYTKLNSSFWWLPSTKNRLILFPSWLQHCVHENNEKEPRISIAFNIMFKGKLSSLKLKEYNEF
tara:strand:- start:6115 stop:6711 length:597 start_codon:yes stop_codon:yes gene_type:complete